jgi:hypothetical protein
MLIVYSIYPLGARSPALSGGFGNLPSFFVHFFSRI